MSSKLARLVSLCLLLSAASCGVKGPPRPPKGATIPSLEEQQPELKLKPGQVYPVKAP